MSTVDDDDIFGDPADDDPADADPPATPAPTGSTPAAAAEPTVPAAAPEPTPAVDQNAELIQAALGTLKSEWAAAAKAAGFSAAEFEKIGLKGFTEDSKAQFLAEAKASHEARVKELESLGFHFDPSKSADEAAKAKAAAEDAAAKDAWGPTGPSTSATEGEVADEAVQQAVKAGDTMGAIKALGGLGDFIMRGKRA